MKNITATCLLWFFLPLAMPIQAGQAAAQQQEEKSNLRKEFLAEAPARWQEYVARARQLQGSHSLALTQTLEQTTIEMHYVEKRNNSCVLLQKSTESSRNNQAKPPAHTVMAANPFYGFELHREGVKSAWAVTEIARRQDTTGPAKLSAAYDDVISQYFLVRLHSQFLSDVIGKTEFKVLGCRWVAHGNEKRVEVEFDYPHEVKKASDNRVQSGKLLLDPQRSWCLLGYEVRTRTESSQGTMKMQVLEMDDSDKAFPVPKKAVMVNHVTIDGTENHQEWQFEWNLAVPRRLPADEEFTLRAFGFPEPRFGLPQPASHSYLIFVAIGIAGLILGSLCWRRYRRLKANAPAGPEIPPPRPGFTLVELLVVLAIMGVLLALLLPAVQKVRGAALRAECLNNLKQIGLAAQQFHDTAKAFPAGMRGQDPLKYSSWLAAVLPYLEQDNLWRITQDAYEQSSWPFKNPPHVGLATPIHAYSCPADGRAEQAAFAPIDKFPVALTNYLGVSGKDLTTLDGILFRDSRIRMGDITDGTSQTLLAGERPPSANLQFGWWYAGVGQKFTGSADVVLGVEEQNVLPIVKGGCPPGTYQFAPGTISDQCDMFHFWSPHAGGAQFLFADGSVRWLRYEAAPIMPALASRAGNDVANAQDY